MSASEKDLVGGTFLVGDVNGVEAAVDEAELTALEVKTGNRVAQRAVRTLLPMKTGMKSTALWYR